MSRLSNRLFAMAARITPPMAPAWLWAGGLFQAGTISGWTSLFAIFALLILLCIGAYVFGLIPYMELSLGEIFKNALIFQVLCLGRNLGFLALLVLLAGLLAVLMPLSVPIVLVSIVPVFGYTMAYCTHGSVKKYLTAQEQEAAQIP